MTESQKQAIRTETELKEKIVECVNGIIKTEDTFEASRLSDNIEIFVKKLRHNKNYMPK
mgnify:FL=1